MKPTLFKMYLYLIFKHQENHFKFCFKKPLQKSIFLKAFPIDKIPIDLYKTKFCRSHFYLRILSHQWVLSHQTAHTNNFLIGQTLATIYV